MNLCARVINNVTRSLLSFYKYNEIHSITIEQPGYRNTYAVYIHFTYKKLMLNDA